MKIGKLAVATRKRKVDEVDAELIALTGCSAAEIRDGLAQRCLAGTVAAALLPLLAEPIERHALAEAISAAGVDQVQPQVRALYLKLLPPQPSAEAPPEDEASGEAGDGESQE